MQIAFRAGNGFVVRGPSESIRDGWNWKTMRRVTIKLYCGNKLDVIYSRPDLRKKGLALESRVSIDSETSNQRHLSLNFFRRAYVTRHS